MMNLTQSQIEKMAEFVSDINGGDAEDYCDMVVTTREGLDMAGNWDTADAVNDQDDFYGFPAIHYAGVKIAAGQPRHDLFVMDFGDFRGVVKI